MSQVLSYHISDLSIAFFAKGRPYNVPSDHPSFYEIKGRLLNQVLDAEPLIELADIKVALQNADKGKLLQFVGDMLCYGDTPLNGVWVEKLMAFRAEGLDFEPVFKGLQSLLENPTPDARERFPIFAERNKFGFFADGRVGAYKAVGSDFFDLHSHTFDNSPGKVVEMPRDAVDDDPNQTCSRGLHLGALDYVRHYQPEAGKIVFCAFWPKDVVAVPTDYDGTKMRVCRYEVLEEVDPAFVEEFLGARTTLIKSLFQNGYLKGWDLFNSDDYVGSLQEMIDTRATLDEGEYRDGFDKGWRDASADKDFDDVPENENENENENDWY
jgi:hypothetical protein